MNKRLLKQIALVFILTFGTQFSANAQNVGINETGANPDPSAMLDIATSNKGLLIPRLSKAQKSLISSVANHLLINNIINLSKRYAIQIQQKKLRYRM